MIRGESHGCCNHATLFISVYLLFSNDKLCGLFIIADNIQFIKGGWINRNSILINDEANLITLPLIKGSSCLMINERYFVNDSSSKGKCQVV